MFLYMFVVAVFFIIFLLVTDKDLIKPCIKTNKPQAYRFDIETLTAYFWSIFVHIRNMLQIQKDI